MSLSIAEIKQAFEQTSFEYLPQIVEEYSEDTRMGVQKLCSTYLKKHNAYLAELERLSKISEFEKSLRRNGYKLIAGIDEVGRGPLAGPVVTAAVILREDCKILGINDSKKLSAQKRKELDIRIKEEAIAYSFGVVSPKEIDDINILRATYKAMQKAILGLSSTPDFILVDAVTIPEIDIPQNGIIGGDGKSISIGAASIIAKVHRDSMMEEYDSIYPEYGFAKNKGYGSAEHILALKKYGACPIHRRSFIKNFVD